MQYETRARVKTPRYVPAFCNSNCIFMATTYPSYVVVFASNPSHGVATVGRRRLTSAQTLVIAR